MSKILIRLLFLLAALLLMAFLVIRHVFRKGPEDLSRVKTEFVLSASQLHSDYSADETMANTKYSGKVVELSGQLIDKTADEWGQTLLTFIDLFFGVTCTIDSLGSIRQESLIQGLSVGDSVKLKGRIDGMLSDVRLSKCMILDE